jgi:hypothetical protein
MRLRRILLIQHGSGQAAELIELVTPWHIYAAGVVGHEYRADTRELVTGRKPYWEKIDRIIKALDDVEDGGLVVWLDADCVIRKPVDFGQVLPPETNLGMVKDNLDRFNGGVQIVRACPYTRAYYAEHFRRGPVSDEERVTDPSARAGNIGGDDARTNVMLSHGFPGIVVHVLERKWNCSRVTPAPHMEPLARINYPLVEGFHCERHPVKVVLMRNRLGIVRKEHGWNP